MRLSSILCTAALAGCGSASSPADGPAAVDSAIAGDGGAPGADLAVTPMLSVSTDKGVVSGKLVGAGTRAFLGVPYAAPPVAALRWRPPQPAAPWAAPRDATRLAPMCPQMSLIGAGLANGIDEDCLYLNVWTPVAPAAPRPVMVWLHGGGFTSGSSGDAWYNGAQLSATGDIVVVTINYRLGPLGFLAHPALTHEDAGHLSSGNQGFEDQRAALAWVKANAQAFGGDPARVTVFGESAGAISICGHEVSPPAQGLYQRALMESTVCGVPVPTLATAEKQGGDLATALGCTDPAAEKTLACLRGKSMSDVVMALPLKAGFLLGPGVNWGPVVDGLDLPDQPATLWAAGKFGKSPMLLGTNGDEGTIFLSLAELGGQMIATEADYKAAVGAIFSAWAAQILATYPVASFPTPRAALAEVLGDGLFVCPTRQIARALATAGVPVFQYSFKHAFNFPLLPGPLGAFHGSETGFVFGGGFAGVPLAPDELPLSQAIMGYWSRYAAAGDPNGSGAPMWPAFTVAGDAYLTLDLTIAAGTGLKKSKCDFWNTLHP